MGAGNAARRPVLARREGLVRVRHGPGRALNRASASLTDGLVSGCTAWRDHEWVKPLVDGRLPRSTRLTRSFRVLSYPSGMTVSSRALGMLADALRRHRSERVRPAGASSRPAIRPCQAVSTSREPRPRRRACCRVGGALRCVRPSQTAESSSLSAGGEEGRCRGRPRPHVSLFSAHSPTRRRVRPNSSTRSPPRKTYPR
jgi:hypothetical protein